LQALFYLYEYKSPVQKVVQNAPAKGWQMRLVIIR